jgi:transcriptional regulator with XRE-family HTH domain
MKITELRMTSDLPMKEFAKSIGLSPSTLARIEAAEREGRKHPISYRVLFHLQKALSKKMERKVTLEELEGVMVVPPRPGRPKGVKKTKKEEEL